MKRSVLTLAALLIVTAMPAMVEAAVLCANPSGSIFVRTACKSGETALDPATLGLVGPPGPAGPRGEAGPAGPMGPIGATGSSGVSGWEQKTGHFECSNQSYCAGYLSCPAGKRLLGGGAYLTLEVWRLPEPVGFGLTFTAMMAVGYGLFRLINRS